jgi:hypothetical protein
MMATSGLNYWKSGVLLASFGSVHHLPSVSAAAIDILSRSPRPIPDGLISQLCFSAYRTRSTEVAAFVLKQVAANQCALGAPETEALLLTVVGSPMLLSELAVNANFLSPSLDLDALVRFSLQLSSAEQVDALLEAFPEPSRAPCWVADSVIMRRLAVEDSGFDDAVMSLQTRGFSISDEGRDAASYASLVSRCLEWLQQPPLTIPSDVATHGSLVFGTLIAALQRALAGDPQAAREYLSNVQSSTPLADDAKALVSRIESHHAVLK